MGAVCWCLRPGMQQLCRATRLASISSCQLLTASCSRRHHQAAPLPLPPAGLQSQQNICFGDSGGPLLRLGDSAASDVQLGITSFSFPECALPGMPSVFTFLPRYR